MKKEKLLQVKEEMVQNELSYTGLEITENELRCFSVKQLEIICNILKRNKETVKKRSNFVGLSTTAVLCKENNKIVDFDFEGTGEVKEVSREYIMSGASRSALERYENAKSNS